MSARGYTIVELMMALTVLAIGVSGIIAMQKIAVSTNQHAKNLALATHVAQAWQDRLATDAAQWNHPSPQTNVSDLGDTRWLDGIVANEGQWIRPSYDPNLDFGAGFDALGNVVDDSNPQQAVFCAHMRLTWLYPDNAGNGLIRTEVRVFWPRDSMGGTGDNDPACDPGRPASNIDAKPDRYHFVYQTSAVKQNTAP